ncbi:MBL fold metallo-hydrolase [Bordetella sp. 2513F-2]
MPATVATLARTARRALSVLVLAAGTVLSAPPGAQAGAPVHAAQAPGYYRMAVGGYMITALYDGYVDLPPTVLSGAAAADVRKLLEDMYANRATGMQTSVNAYLIHDGKQLVLVDTGGGECLGPTLGTLEANLAAAGYAPADVDAVLLTHLHPDHACGLLPAGGTPRFPRADVYVSAEEAAFWLSPSVAAQSPAEAQPYFEMARKAVAPYLDEGRFLTYRAGEALPAGAVAVPAPGHTPGHTAYLFGAGAERLLVWGDVVHSHAVQMARPEVAVEFDVDGTQAIATRKQLFADAARDKAWIAGAHLPFPGLGHVRPTESGYAWIPVEYAPLRKAALRESE